MRRMRRIGRVRAPAGSAAAPRGARRRRGQAMVEFAFVFPFLILTFFGIFDVARLMFVRISQDAATEAAARLVSMNDPALTRGKVYKAVVASAPGVRIPAPALTIRKFDGPDGKPWARVRISTRQGVLSAFYVTSGYEVRVTSVAEVPLHVRAGGAVHVP